MSRLGMAKNILEKKIKSAEEKNVFMWKKTCGTEGVDCARLCSNHLVYLQHTKNMFFMFILTRLRRPRRECQKKF